jgi:hypothetical protein
LIYYCTIFRCLQIVENLSASDSAFARDSLLSYPNSPPLREASPVDDTVFKR